MSADYATPKLENRRVPTRIRITPDQHAYAVAQATRHGLSMSAYIGALLDQDRAQVTAPDQEGTPMPRTA